MTRAPIIETGVRFGAGLLALGLCGCPETDDGPAATTGTDGSTEGTDSAVTPPGVTGPVPTDGDTSTGSGADSGSETADPDSGSATDSGTTGPGTTDGTSDGATDSTDTGSSSSSSGGLVCDAPEENCNDECVDTTMSADHCGACNDPCPGDDICVESMCVAEQELIANGDFGSGLNHWMTSNNPDQVATCDGAPDDELFVFVDGGGFAFNGPSTGPSSHVIYQDFDVPMGIAAATFSIEYAQDPPMPLDPANVQTIIKDCLDENMDGASENAFRIDLVDPNDDVFVAPIAFEVATPDMSAGDPLAVAPMLVNITVADGALLAYLQGEEGNTLRLRIAQVESTIPWNIAFDDVSLNVELN